MAAMKPPPEASPPPEVRPVKLQHDYNFMYDVAVFSDQHSVYLFMEHRGDGVRALVFGGGSFKLGAPNDEALGGHPLVRFGLRSYDFFEVTNSPWIAELCRANRVHPSHGDWMFENERHFIATFKDTTFEIVCRAFEERQLSIEEVRAIVESQIPGFSPRAE